MKSLAYLVNIFENTSTNWWINLHGTYLHLEYPVLNHLLLILPTLIGEEHLSLLSHCRSIQSRDGSAERGHFHQQAVSMIESIPECLWKGWIALHLTPLCTLDISRASQSIYPLLQVDLPHRQRRVFVTRLSPATNAARASNETSSAKMNSLKAKLHVNTV
jgi:hypothetical protein